jgi:hypothetical protein
MMRHIPDGETSKQWVVHIYISPQNCNYVICINITCIKILWQEYYCNWDNVYVTYV